MVISIDHRNKIFIGIFIFIVSIYFSTTIHEFGHGLFYLIFGCKSVGVFTSPLIIGFTQCYYPEDFESELMQNQAVLSGFGGILFASVVGMVLFLIYKVWTYVRKSYVLALIFYFFSFTSLANGFMQSIMSGDVVYLVNNFNVNRIYFYIVAIVTGLFLIQQIFDFRGLLKIVEPVIQKKSIRKWYIIFLSLIVIYSVIYFSLPFIL